MSCLRAQMTLKGPLTSKVNLHSTVSLPDQSELFSRFPIISTTKQPHPLRVETISNGLIQNDFLCLGFCAQEGTIYAEGSAMKSSTPCENCFCIRGEMKCSRPQCVIPLNGCKPRYRSFACCPTNYDCCKLLVSRIGSQSHNPEIMT